MFTVEGLTMALAIEQSGCTLKKSLAEWGNGQMGKYNNWQTKAEISIITCKRQKLTQNKMLSSSVVSALTLWITFLFSRLPVFWGVRFLSHHHFLLIPLLFLWLLLFICFPRTSHSLIEHKNKKIYAMLLSCIWYIVGSQ